MVNHAALIERARKLGGLSRTTDTIIRALADALEAATVERAVVEAQALEQAADDLWKWATSEGALDAVGWLRARAVEIREGQQ